MTGIVTDITKGTWLVDRRKDHDLNAVDVIALRPAGAVTVCTVMDDKTLDLESLANAQAIAQVPAMLELLRAVRPHLLLAPRKHEHQLDAMRRIFHAIYGEDYA